MSTATKTIQERAESIARCVSTICLGMDRAKVEQQFAEEIVKLVREATNGAPKPVLPPRADRHLEPWEGRGWGIFHLEDDGGPVAIFTEQGDAEREMKRRQALDSDDVDALPFHDMGVMSCDIALLVWNNYEPDPRGEP